MATLLITSSDVGHLLDVDTIERHVNLVVLIDFKRLVALYFCCNPIGLHGACQSYYLLAQVGGALDVDVIVVNRHACVVHSKLDALVDIVKVLLLLGFRLGYTWHRVWRLCLGFLMNWLQRLVHLGVLSHRYGW